MAGDAQALVDLIASCDTNTFATTAAATAAGVDDFGNAYDAGAPLMADAAGNVLCLDKASATEAAAAGVDANGTPYEAGDEVITIPGYGDIALVSRNSATLPDSVFQDINGTPADMTNEVSAYLAQNPTSDSLFANQKSGGLWGTDRNGAAVCLVAPSFDKECGWIAYQEEDQSTFTWTDLTPTSTQLKVFRVSTPLGFEAVLELNPEQNQGWAIPPAVNANNQAFSAILTNGTIYTYRQTLTKTPNIQTVNGCPIKFTTRHAVADLDVNTTIRGTSMWGETFPAANGVVGQSNNGFLNAAYPNIDTQSFYDLQTEFPNNAPNGLNIYSDSTTPMNISTGELQSNGAGTSDAIVFGLLVYTAMPVDIFRSKKDGTVCAVEGINGAEIDIANVVYTQSDCF